VDTAVAAANRAFKFGEWATTTGTQRASYLNKLADLIDKNGQALAYFESLASGRPFSMILRGDIPRVADVFRCTFCFLLSDLNCRYLIGLLFWVDYAGWADKIRGDSYPPDDGFYKIVEHKPLGVCAAVTAWNGSLHFLAWKAAPALALGNTVIVKPSEKSPLGSLAFGHLIRDAGFPPGVFNIIVGKTHSNNYYAFVTNICQGDGSVGQALSSHMDIHKISFTGSLATGKKVQIAATESNLKRVTLELGGKSPAIVFEDADLETAILWSIRGITANSGQICAATSRLFVHEKIADIFITRLQDAFKAIAAALGADPQEPTTTYGPLVDRTQYEKVLEYIRDGKNSADMVVGDQENAGNGYYVSPTIFKNVDQNSNLYREEIFGPVLCVETFKDEAEVLKMANDTEYGLAGSIYTQNISRAIRIWRQVDSGTICINCAAMVGPQVPTGGFKSSGVGRELGEYALRHYSEPRTIWIKYVKIH
jgi:aldehyde dehydrogenase (NAD+)